MARLMDDLSKKKYPEVFAVYQALGAFLVRMLNSRWANKSSTPIYEFLFQEVNGIVKSTNQTKGARSTGWPNTWSNWGTIAAIDRPFLGNSPERVHDVLAWAVTKQLLKKTEARVFSKMFNTLVNWQERMTHQPEDVHDNVIFIVDTAAQLAGLELGDSSKSPSGSVYVDKLTGDVFDFVSLQLVYQGESRRDRLEENVREAVLHLMKVGEALVDLVPMEHVANEENWSDDPLPMNRKTVHMSLLMQEGEHLFMRIYKKGGRVAAKQFLDAMKEKLKNSDNN